jgi:hypothetical protein
MRYRCSALPYIIAAAVLYGTVGALRILNGSWIFDFEVLSKFGDQHHYI